MGALFVLGSINQDFVLRLERRPEPGETVTDAELSLHPGGKGANQGVAAACLGAKDLGRASAAELAFGLWLAACHIPMITSGPTSTATLPIGRMDFFPAMVVIVNKRSYESYVYPFTRATIWVLTRRRKVALIIRNRLR